MANPNYSAQGWVARSLARAKRVFDANPSDSTGPRFNGWNEFFGEIPMLGEPALSEEGSLFMSSMLPSATALQLGISATYSATAAALVFKNNAAIKSDIRCSLREIHFLCATAPASGTSLLYASATDVVNRAPTTVSGIGSPGTPATVTAYQAPAVCLNIDEPSTPNGVWWFPLSTAAGAPPTIPAQGSNARILVGNGNLRTVIPVGALTSGVQDDYRIVFGATDRVQTGGSLRSSAGATQISEPHPAVTIGPQEFFILYLWAPSNAAAGLAFAGLDGSWSER